MVGVIMDYSLQDLMRIYQMKQTQNQRDADMPYELKNATQALALEKVESERQSLKDAARARDEAYIKAKADESMSNSLARKWQSKIEGGANVTKKMSLEEYQATFGKDKEYPSGGAYTGSWQPNAEPYTGEIPAEAKVAYGKYMGLPVDTVHKERELKAKEKEAAERSRVTEETKLAEIEYKKQALIEKEKDERQKIIDKKIGTMQTLFAKAKSDYDNELDTLQFRYGNNPEVYEKEYTRITTAYNDKLNNLMSIANQNGLIDSETGKPYEFIDRLTGKPSFKTSTNVQGKKPTVSMTMVQTSAKNAGVPLIDAIKKLSVTYDIVD